MKRIVLGIEYDGTHFSGWQFQPGLRTIQDELEKAISKVADERIQITCAGRTDAGVHAIGQVIHFDTNAKRPEKAWFLGVNSNLQNDIVVTWAKEISSEFSARFSAIERHYCYLINTDKVNSAINRHRMLWHPTLLDTLAMQEAAQYLLGEHDFSSFRAADCQSTSPMRCMNEILISRQQSIIRMDFRANAFLHHMVRNIVGTLLPIGHLKKSPTWMKEVLSAKDRKAADITAAPHGLYLIKMRYPEEFNMPLAAQLNLIVF